jgi:peroxin-5
MTSVEAWYSLGVKQQENEREGKAILALKRALTLDPAHLPSWLALAISSTNDNDRMGTYNAIKEWVERNEQYQGAAESFKLKLGNGTADKSMTEKFDDLVQCLIEMARSSTGVEVDADVQIALAVILNTIDVSRLVLLSPRCLGLTELIQDYAKSRDCFLAALAVRPDDWLLYNRVGATLANSGHSEQAVGYYHKALELNPAYIRARFV